MTQPLDQAVDPAPGERMTVVFFGNDWGAENRTSSHHIARWLGRRHRVLYVECPGLRAPSASGRDLKKAFRKVIRALRGPTAVPEGLSVMTLFQLPFHGSRSVRWLNCRLGRAALRLHLWRAGIRQPVLWFMVPHVGYLAGGLGAALSVYYCIDDYASLPNVDREAVARMDEALTRRADLVFVASDTLVPAKRALNPRVLASPHGVDVEHFARAGAPETEVPGDLRALPHPVIGFFGLIEAWIDLGLVAWLAEQRPHWSFALIGRVAVPEAQIPRRANLHYFGWRPYDSLPAYGKGFDAAIIPYHLTPQVLHANPIKLREYLAMGVPVVSVRTPEIAKFGAVVRIADTREEFLGALDAALGSTEPPAKALERQRAVEAMSWDARLQQVESAVRGALAGRAVTPAAEWTTAIRDSGV